MHTHTHTHLHKHGRGTHALILRAPLMQYIPTAAKVICARKEHWEVAVIDRQIAPAETPVWQRKAPNARVKSQPQKSPQCTSHESKLEYFARLWEAEHLWWDVVGENIRLLLLSFSFFFFQMKKPNALCANPGANHEHASLRARPHADVSSVLHYNSTPDLEEWHSSKSGTRSSAQLCQGGKTGVIKSARLSLQETL